MKNLDLVAGGQGRLAEEVRASAILLGVCLLGLLVLGGYSILFGGRSGSETGRPSPSSLEAGR